MVWTSNLDGKIGTGGLFNAVLSSGTHIITTTVTDSGGLTSSNTITITVESPLIQKVKVVSLVGSSSTPNKTKWTATVDITVNPALAGAVVTGTWSGGAGFTCTTDSLGICTVKLTVSTKTTSTTLIIQNIVLAGYEYDPSSVITVTVNKP